MATLSSRVAALEAWKTAHINGHVLSGHSHGHNHDAAYSPLAHTHASPAPEPAPPPPPAPGTLVPVGSFSTAIPAAAAGTTLNIASGTHPDTLVRLTAQGVSIIGQTPRPLIKPPARPNGLFVQASRTLVRNLDFAGTAPGTGYNDANGSALLEVLGEAAPVTDSVVEDVSFDLPSGAGSRQHGAYLAYDIERLTMRRITANGHASAGGRADALTAYHPGKAPTKDIVIEDWVLTDFYNAVVFWLKCTSLTFRRCTFISTLNSDIQVDTGGPVYLEGCKGRKGVIATSQYAGAATPTTLVDRGGNDWSWTP